jgi:hypothetical protein
MKPQHNLIRVGTLRIIIIYYYVIIALLYIIDRDQLSDRPPGEEPTLVTVANPGEGKLPAFCLASSDAIFDTFNFNLKRKAFICQDRLGTNGRKG